MSINLPYVESNCEKLWCTLRSHKIKSTFYNKNTSRELLCKSKDKVAKKIKTISFMRLTVLSVKQSTFGESKRSLKSCSDEYKGSV